MSANDASFATEEDKTTSPRAQSAGDDSKSAESSDKEKMQGLDVLSRRDLRVFRPTDIPFDPRRVELPEDFYSPTTADVKASHESLNSLTKALEEAPLMTTKMRNAQQAEKMSRFRKVLIRIRFPDRVSLQGTFAPKDEVREIAKFVKAALRDPANVRYHLFVTPPKTVLKDPKATLWSLGLVPAALIHVNIERGPSSSAELLRDDVLSRLEDTPAPVGAVHSSTAPPVKPESSSTKAEDDGRAAGPSSGYKALKMSAPKWLKKK